MTQEGDAVPEFEDVTEAVTEPIVVDSGGTYDDQAAADEVGDLGIEAMPQ